MLQSEKIIFKKTPSKHYLKGLQALLKSTGFFRPSEVKLGVSLLKERLEKGKKSGYSFIFALRGKELVGYSCYGHIDGTVSSFDLFWIAVSNKSRGCGIGKTLLKLTESDVIKMGGKRIYAETSSQKLYIPTRAFYESSAYKVDSVNKDYYAKGDSKVTYVKRL